MPKFTDTPILSGKYIAALAYAAQAHQHQVTESINPHPFISGLLTVSSLVLASGGNETEAIAALLHKICCDVEVEPLLIADKFGYEVTDIIKELSHKSLAEEASSISLISDSAIRVSLAKNLHLLQFYSKERELYKADSYAFYNQALKNYAKRVYKLGTGVVGQYEEMRLLYINVCQTKL